MLPGREGPTIARVSGPTATRGRARLEASATHTASRINKGGDSWGSVGMFVSPIPQPF